MRKKLKSSISQLLKLIFALGLIYWLVRSDRLDFKALTFLLHPIYLVPCLGCLCISLLIATERWRLFLKSQNLSVSFFHAFQLTLIGQFFSFVMPGGVSGDLVKGYYITKSSGHAKVAAAITVFLDRLIGLLAMSIIALVVLTLEWQKVRAHHELIVIFMLVAGVTAASLIIWSLIFSRRLFDLGWVEKILNWLPRSHTTLKAYYSVAEYRHSKKVFFSSLAFSFASQLTGILFFVFAGRGLGYDLPLTTYFAVIPVAFMVQSLPISPGGVGVGQWVSLFLFNLFAPDTGHLGSAAMTAYQIAQFLYGLWGAYFYLGISKKLMEEYT